MMMRKAMMLDDTLHCPLLLDDDDDDDADDADDADHYDDYDDYDNGVDGCY